MHIALSVYTVHLLSMAEMYEIYGLPSLTNASTMIIGCWKNEKIPTSFGEWTWCVPNVFRVEHGQNRGKIHTAHTVWRWTISSMRWTKNEKQYSKIRLSEQRRVYMIIATNMFVSNTRIAREEERNKIWKICTSFYCRLFLIVCRLLRH